MNLQTVQFRKVKWISPFDFGTQTNIVVTRYLGSEFMGISIAEDVLQTFLAGISDLDQSKIFQVASDGPNVNLLFLKKLIESREEKELLPLLLILVDVVFTLSLIVLKQGRKKAAIGKFKNC